MGVYVFTDGAWQAVTDGGGPPPPEDERQMLVGAALSSFPGSYFDSYNADVGPLRIMRRYDNNQGVPNSFSDRNDFVYLRNNDMALAFSFKHNHAQIANGSYDQKLINFVDSWPSDMPGYLLVDNEPDQNSKGLNPNTFRAAVERVYSVLGGYNPKPNIKLGIALMQYTFRPQLDAATAGVQWLPNVPKLNVDIHCYGLTHHNHISTMLPTFMQRMEERPEWTWGMGELGAEEKSGAPNSKGNWFRSCGDWSFENGAEYWCPFDAGVGGSSPIRTSAQATAGAKYVATTYDAGPQVWSA